MTNLVTINSNQTLVKMILDRWHASVKNFDSLLDALSDEQLQKEIAPGRNRGTYILGHLIAVHDDMRLLLDMGEKLFPHLNGIFIKLPDKTVKEIPSASELRVNWKTMNEELNRHFETLQADDWFIKHTAVSAGEFANEPHRNKLNIILTRTTHLAYHTGQLRLLS
jgi:hypothetical protein